VCCGVSLLSTLSVLAQSESVELDLFPITEKPIKDQKFSLGIDAFIQNNYSVARKYWLQAARQNHAKAMFNLGLLHERRLIDSATDQQAEKWYRLSGDRGYAAAYYHLAIVLVSNPNRVDETNALLRKAAEAGFVPAIKQLQNNGQKSYLSEAWLGEKPKNHWTIQMLAFQDEYKVKDFINQHALNDRAAYFVERNNNGVWYKLVYGAYSNKQQADAARNAMPNVLKEYGPWLRTIGSVQEIIQAN